MKSVARNIETDYSENPFTKGYVVTLFSLNLMFAYFQFRIVVPMMGGISDLCDALSKISGIPAENVRIKHKSLPFF